MICIWNVIRTASSSDEDSCAGDSELPPPPELSSPPARRPAAPIPRVLPHPLPQPHHARDKKQPPRTEIDIAELTHLPTCEYNYKIKKKHCFSNVTLGNGHEHYL